MIATVPPAPVVIQHEHAEHRVRIVIVHDGDTLSSIAKHRYGTAERWPAIYWQNKNKISNPEILRTGMHLRVGAYHELKGWQIAKALRKDTYVPKHASPVVVVAQQVPAAPAAAPVPASPAPAPAVNAGGFEACVIQAESGGDPTAINPSSGASGLFGFLPSTWASLGLGYPGGAYTAPASVQMEGFSILFARDGTSPWAPFDGC